MENYFHITVKLTAAIYILWRIWNVLFRRRLYGFWEWAFGMGRTPAPAIKRSVDKIIGRTNIVLLDDPRAEPKPVISIELEQTGLIELAKPVSPEDIESPESPYIPSEDELDVPPPDRNEMSSGVSFDDLPGTADVLARGTTDGERRIRAAKTLYDLQGTEVLDLILREVCQGAAIDNLLKTCLDGDGFPLPKPKPLADFEMGRYV